MRFTGLKDDFDMIHARGDYQVWENLDSDKVHYRILKRHARKGTDDTFDFYKDVRSIERVLHYVGLDSSLELGRDEC